MRFLWNKYNFFGIKSKKGNIVEMLLEICAANIQSAINAETAGAHRIELCSELAVGGLTPSFGMIQEVLKKVSIPVFVLIRPRSGNFTYSEDEFEIMKADILNCKKMGCAGIVSGVLKVDNSIDVIRTKELVELSRPLPFTFHRAFDWVSNPTEAIETLIDISVHRVLTSGQSSTAEKGIEFLTQLHQQANNRIHILPGGGINEYNVKLFKDAGFEELHTSASALVKKTQKPSISMNSNKFFEENKVYESSVESIRAVLLKLGDVK
jgi:copper homeostasis protein